MGTYSRRPRPAEPSTESRSPQTFRTPARSADESGGRMPGAHSARARARSAIGLREDARRARQNSRSDHGAGWTARALHSLTQEQVRASTTDETLPTARASRPTASAINGTVTDSASSMALTIRLRLLHAGPARGPSRRSPRPPSPTPMSFPTHPRRHADRGLAPAALVIILFACLGGCGDDSAERRDNQLRANMQLQNGRDRGQLDGWPRKLGAESLRLPKRQRRRSVPDGSERWKTQLFHSARDRRGDGHAFFDDVREGIERRLSRDAGDVRTRYERRRVRGGDADTLLGGQIATHEAIYDRTALDLNASASDRARSNDELLSMQATSSVPVKALWERVFDAGRYHFLSSSSATTPPDLLGIWTGDTNAGWGGFYTLGAVARVVHLSAGVVTSISIGIATASDAGELREGGD